MNTNQTTTMLNDLACATFILEHACDYLLLHSYPDFQDDGDLLAVMVMACAREAVLEQRHQLRQAS